MDFMKEEFIEEDGLISPIKEESTDAELKAEHFEDDPFEAEDLNVKNIETKAWLVKLPKFLATKWTELDRDDTPLGILRIYGDRTNKIQLILSDIDEHADIPKEYDLSIVNPDVDDTYAFYQAKDTGGRENGGVSMQATVHHNCHIRPKIGGDYSRKLRERTLRAEQPQRHIKMMDENENRGAYVPPGASAAAIAKFGNLVQKKAKVPMEQKTTRMPKNELYDLLFHAFELYSYWTLRGLKDFVKQPESYLKDVLTEIAILDKRGPYNNCYHVKPEYKRQSVNDAIAPPGLEPAPSFVNHGEGRVTTIEGDDDELEEIEGDEAEEEEEEDMGIDEDLE